MFSWPSCASFDLPAHFGSLLCGSSVAAVNEFCFMAPAGTANTTGSFKKKTPAFGHIS